MIQLPKVSLICIDCYNYGKAVSSLQKSMVQCEFGEVIFFTDIQIEVKGVKVIQIPSIRSKDEYSEFILKYASGCIETDYALITQHDSWVLDGERFDDRLYDVDYAGALWLEQDGLANGNGGFSWRSKKLMDIVANDKFIKATAPEDVALCRVYRNYLEKTYNLKWASDEICEQFSFELKEPNQKTFGFHGNFHLPYRPTVVIKRSAALGDCIIMEPVMRYYALKGYAIFLDIPLPYFELYSNHYFQVKHISQFDKGRIKPEKTINLDLAYEVKPKQNYLKSYFEFSGITDYKLTKPQLYPLVDHKTKLFEKYCVIHIDRRETEHRNIYEVNWRNVQRHLEALGYTVIQIGKNDREQVGLYINTPSIGFMKFVIAGCDIFIGVDSAPSHIAVAYNKPSAIFFGSVCPDYIHSDLTNVVPIQGNCEKAFCWHSEDGGTAGVKCAFIGTEKHLQCCKVPFDEVIYAINILHNNQQISNEGI